MNVLDSGTKPFRAPNPDGFREWVREHKTRELKNKVMNEHEAISRYVEDGDYLCYESCYIMRGPSSLVRELARQRKRNLWLGAKFSYFETTLLVAVGSVSKVDVGFSGFGRSFFKTVEAGQIQTIEWTNNAITMRLMAGAMGIPFIPARFLTGTDCFPNSGAKLVEDPFTGDPVCLLPALNPDVSLIHVQQCDVYGNSRIFGVAISPVEQAMASRKVIVSTEEIIDNEEIRRNPGLTTIPYYFVDAVVHAPFGAHPGPVQGYYGSDTEHIVELFELANSDHFEDYVEKYVDSVSSHEEYLEKRVGLPRLLQMQKNEVIREGYHR